MSTMDVILSAGASKDVSMLIAGKDRVDVALEALREEYLSPPQVKALLKLAEKYEAAQMQSHAKDEAGDVL